MTQFPPTNYLDELFRRLTAQCYLGGWAGRTNYVLINVSKAYLMFLFFATEE